jgi:quercetin dioxygenase-like cupin family protein
VYRVLGALDCTVLARNVDTGHACDVMEAVFPPQSGMPAHRHHRSDEAVYVLQGQLVLQVGDRTVNATQGTLGYIPRETVHAMHNASSESCRILLWQSPGVDGQAQLEEMSQLPPGPLDLSQLLPLFAKYDIEPVAPTQ